MPCHGVAMARQLSLPAANCPTPYPSGLYLLLMNDIESCIDRPGKTGSVVIADHGAAPGGPLHCSCLISTRFPPLWLVLPWLLLCDVPLLRLHSRLPHNLPRSPLLPHALLLLLCLDLLPLDLLLLPAPPG